MSELPPDKYDYVDDVDILDLGSTVSEKFYKQDIPPEVKEESQKQIIYLKEWMTKLGDKTVSYSIMEDSIKPDKTAIQIEALKLSEQVLREEGYETTYKKDPHDERIKSDDTAILRADGNTKKDDNSFVGQGNYFKSKSKKSSQYVPPIKHNLSFRRPHQ